MNVRAATLKDVAREAGVSIQTVSRILRGDIGQHRDSTRQRILDVAARLGYRPSRSAGRSTLGVAAPSSMPLGPVRRVAIITRGLGSVTAVARLRHMTRELRHRGYRCYLCNLDRPDDGEAELVATCQDLIDRGVGGIIICGSSPVPVATRRWLQVQFVPIVFVGWGPPRWPARIVFDRQAAAKSVAEHLAGLNHRCAALLATMHAWHFPENRILPYQRAFREQGIELRAKPQWTIAEEPGMAADAYDRVRQLLREDNDVTALVMNNDIAAMAAIAAARDLGLVVPDDISVIGFDDQPAAQFAVPPLTTVRTPIHEAAEQAVIMLQTLMQSSESVIKPVECALELVVRSSTAPASQCPRGLVKDSTGASSTSPDVHN